MSEADYLGLPRVPPHHVAAYGAASSCFGELYRPAGPGPHPVAIVLHGGCWKTRYDLAPVSGLAAALARAGVAAWSLEYRRLEDGGGWPETFRDVGAGADHLRALAGPFALDLERVVTLGHSAGGTLALWLAARPTLPRASALATRDPLPVRAAISLAGLADLAEGERRGLCGDACVRLMGGSPAERPERYRDGSPAERPPRVPHVHVVGDGDEVVPPDYVAAAVRAMEGGRGGTLRVVAGAGHFEPVVPTGPCWELVRAAVLAGLGRRLDPPAPAPLG